MNRTFKYIVLLSVICLSRLAIAQSYGNEWIQYDQTYYSFKVYVENLPLYFGDQSDIETGIHKIDYNLLNSAGVPLASFSSENIQIFGREKEIPLWIEDGGDSSIDPGDYILFYTERNDGWLDSALYTAVDGIGNPYYSLYNDTIEYFFTWNTSVNNLRYTAEDNIDYPSYTPASYIWYNRWQSNNGEFAEGEQLNSASSSFFTHGEGWSSPNTNGAAGHTWSGAMTLKYIYKGIGAPDITYKGNHLGRSNANFTDTGNHHVTYTLGAPPFKYVDSIWIGYKGLSLQAQIPNAVIPASGTSTSVISIVPDQGAVTDYQSISTWSFTYPRIPQFDNEPRKEFYVQNSATEAKIRLDITNLTSNAPIIFAHGDVPKKLKASPNGGFATTLLTNSTNGVNQHIVYQDSASIKLVTQLKLINAGSVTPGQFTDFSTMNLEDALLMIYHPKLQIASDEYANYRISPAGGSYSVVQANINELYQQFGGGIEKHINGIRRFTHYVYNQATSKPVGLFLMGKGIREATIGPSLGTRRSVTYFHECLIPSFGQPPSDVCITSNLVGSDKWVPLVPTGRISARTNSELQDYLDKIIEYDFEQDPNGVYDSPNKDWQKQVIHFSGGSDSTQQGQFANYMNVKADKIEDSLFAGNVMRIRKSTSDPLDPTILASVTDRISRGVSLMSYFGHASATNSGFEINLDEPSNWNNYGKYPLMIVNSCYNGNIFQYTNSKSEDFVQIANMGAIGYIASTNVGFAGYLNSYSNVLYDKMAYYEYGKTIGEQMQKAIETIEIPGGSLYTETTCTQMVLNGDPMVRLNHHQKPEIELLPEYVWFTPTDLNLTVDSIEIHIDLKNLGRSVTDTFSLEVKRDFPSSTIDSIYLFQFPYLHYKEEFSFKVPMQPNIALGLNTFSISVDLPTVIDEQYDEIFNNQIVKTLFIDVDGIMPVIPYEFAVVPQDSVTVRASTFNPIADFNTYRFEIDTIDFEGAGSPMHRFAIVSGYGGVKEVNPSEWTLTASPALDGTLVCEDSAVYFWRVSIDGDTNWRESSFQHIIGKTGWGQDHFFQFKKNGFTGLNYNRTNRLREFIQDDKTISVDVYNSFSNAPYNQYFINGNQQDYGLCTTTPTLHVAIIDPITHLPWGTRFVPTNANLGNDFGNANDNGACVPRVMNYFTFRQNNWIELAAFQYLVDSIVPDGHFILVYAPLQGSYSTWNSIAPTMFNTFANLGSDSIYVGRPNLPFAFFCRKGDPSTVIEYNSVNSSDDFTMQAVLEGYDNQGIEQAPLIGPSSNWGNVYWKQDPMEGGSLDTTILKIRAFDNTGSYQFTIDTAFSLNDSILDLNSMIDASIYPYIDLSATYVDTTTFTPAQVDRLHVLFQPVPEAAIDGSTLYTWSAASEVMEGAMIDFAVDVKNIFSVDMDSLLINYWVEDINNNILPIAYARQDSLKVGEVLRDTISFSTGGMVGVNSLWMEVNPYVNGSLFITDQPEQAHFNNLLQVPFSVRLDTINPILDVTFNGNHILNGDIVDPFSEILITLKDDNDFLIMDDISDTTLFGVYITDPLGNLIKIPFVDGLGNTVMQWVPAEPQNKRFKIIWPADFKLDGVYTLLVQGTDRSGNLSGDFDYRVNFEIIHESSITKMMNYPNPFSTSTRFVFTLTGSEAPDEILIQILTVTGRVVREITEDELGIIQIGRNISEYAWDGRDEFGDQLANGVYLYRVLAQINGEDIKHRDSGADSHFKKDFGKMYLLR